MDRSGAVNLQDVTRLRRHIVGLEPLPDCPASTIPRIISIAPQRGVSGSTVTITGVNFGSTPQANTVRFQSGEDPATIVSASPTRIVVTVPSYPRGGLLKNVTITTGGKISNSGTFVVDRFEPRITIEPLALLAGSAPPISISIGMDSGDLAVYRLLIDLQGMVFNTRALPIPH